MMVATIYDNRPDIKCCPHQMPKHDTTNATVPEISRRASNRLRYFGQRGNLSENDSFSSTTHNRMIGPPRTYAGCTNGSLPIFGGDNFRSSCAYENRDDRIIERIGFGQSNTAETASARLTELQGSKYNRDSGAYSTYRNNERL